MQQAVLLIDVPPRAERAFEALTQEMDLRLLEAGGNLDTILDGDKENMELVVLGPGADARIQLAQRIHRTYPNAGLMFLASGTGVQQVQSTVLVSPFLGHETDCVDVEDEKAIRAQARRLLNAARKRRQNAPMISVARSSLSGGPGGQDPVNGVVLGRLLDSAPLGVALLDGRGRVVAWNRRAHELMGRNEEAVLGRSATQALGTREGSWLTNAISRQNSGRTRAQRLASETADAEHLHLEVTIEPLDEASTGARHLLMFQDVTDRVEAKAQLERTLSTLEAKVEERTAELEHQRRFLRRVIDTDPNLVFAKDAEGRFTLANRATAELYGTTVEDLVGKRDIDFNKREEEVAAYREDDLHVIDTGESLFIPEEPATNPETGETRWFQTVKVPMRGADGEIDQVLGVSTDITDRLEAERELRQHATALEQTNKDLEQFAYVTSHDLREPLRMVSSFVQLLERRYGDDLGEEGHEYITYAVEGVERMDNLLRELLHYTQVDRQGPRFETVDLREVLEGVLADLGPRIQGSGARVTHDPMPTLQADPTQMRLVLQNLVSNALKFHDDDSPRVHVGAQREGDHWHLTVQDEGIGFDPEYEEKVFSIFQRLNERGAYEGTGVGLALCRRAIEAHGGEIWADSTPDQGTTFHIELPLDPRLAREQNAPQVAWNPSDAADARASLDVGDEHNGPSRP